MTHDETRDEIAEIRRLLHEMRDELRQAHRRLRVGVVGLSLSLLGVAFLIVVT